MAVASKHLASSHVIRAQREGLHDQLREETYGDEVWGDSGFELSRRSRGEACFR